MHTHICIDIYKYLNIMIDAMKRLKYKNTGLILLVMVFTLPSIQCTEVTGLNDEILPGNGSVDSSLYSESLNGAEIEGIQFMREEEKLARDVYTYLYGLHNMRPFLNISRSEQAHMDAVKYLIDTYGLDDPAGEELAGVFQNEELQKLYKDLIARGSESRVEALKVGALIEEVDIIDLDHELEVNAENEDVIRVYTNLCKASENHLRVFVRLLKFYEVDYEPVKLSPSEFDRIMNE